MADQQSADKLDDALKALSAVADSGEWVAAPYDPKAATVTVGYFGNWRIGRATPGIPGGNYRDMDFGTDEANALLAVELVNAYRAGKLFIRPELGTIPSGDGMSAGRFHCACVFSRPTDFSEAVLVSECAYHTARSELGKPYAWVLVDAKGQREQAAPKWFADGGFDPNTHPHGVEWRDKIAPFGDNVQRGPFRWMPLYERDRSVGDCTDWNRRAREFLQDVPRSTSGERP